jgi:hypothetical protein
MISTTKIPDTFELMSQAFDELNEIKKSCAGGMC